MGSVRALQAVCEQAPVEELLADPYPGIAHVFGEARASLSSSKPSLTAACEGCGSASARDACSGSVQKLAWQRIGHGEAAVFQDDPSLPVEGNQFLKARRLTWA